MKEKIKLTKKEKSKAALLLMAAILVAMPFVSLAIASPIIYFTNNRVKLFKCWIARRWYQTELVGQAQVKTPMLTMSYELVNGQPLVINLEKDLNKNYKKSINDEYFNSLNVGDQVILSYVTHKNDELAKFFKINDIDGCKPYHYYYIGRVNEQPDISCYVPANEKEFLGY